MVVLEISVLIIFSLVFVIVFFFYYLRVREENRILKSALKSKDKLLLNKELEIKELNSASELIFINMSHEIRTPLNGIIGFTQLLNDTSLDKNQKEFVSLIENSSEVLLSVTSHILSRSKINEDIMILKEIPFDIFEKIEYLVEKFSEKAEQKDITLGLYIDPRLSRRWIGDPEKIVLVLISLIENSIMFTPVGGTVSISVKEIKLENNIRSILFSVQDNGMGINRNIQKIIFEAYTQVNKNISREYEDFGMGLAISSKMVNVMGGKLEVESKKGGGAIFSFTLLLQSDSKPEVEKIADLTSLKVGLALPNRSVYRDVDIFLEEYVRTFNAEFSIYYYDDIFGSNSFKIRLPDIMIFDHRYARRKGFLNIIQSLDCNKALITTNGLKSQINKYIHKFDSIIYSPVTLNKTAIMLENIYKNENALWIKKKEIKKLKFKNINVLVVDDNYINQKLIKALLEKLNLNVTLAFNGLEALRMREKNVYDLIFMDIEMPVMSGLEATKKILQYELEHSLKHIPIIALTANALMGDKEKYIKAGIDNYLSKPIRLQKLQYLLALYLEKSN